MSHTFSNIDVNMPLEDDGVLAFIPGISASIDTEPFLVQMMMPFEGPKDTVFLHATFDGDNMGYRFIESPRHNPRLTSLEDKPRTFIREQVVEVMGVTPALVNFAEDFIVDFLSNFIGQLGAISSLMASAKSN